MSGWVGGLEEGRKRDEGKRVRGREGERERGKGRGKESETWGGAREGGREGGRAGGREGGRTEQQRNRIITQSRRKKEKMRRFHREWAAGKVVLIGLPGRLSQERKQGNKRSGKEDSNNMQSLY